MTTHTTPRPKRPDIATVLNAGAPKASTHARRWLIVAGIAIVLVAGIAMALRSGRASETPTYVTEPVSTGDLTVRVSATGKLKPTNTVDVGSELSGLVEAVFVEENAAVRKGQVLARLDTSRLNDQITKSAASLASAEARLAQAAATVKESTATLERLRTVSRLSDGRVPSKSELDAAEAAASRAVGERASAEATVTEARATLNSDRTNMSKATIRSPINGIVLARAVEPGQTVAASLQVATLFTIAEDLSQMELEVDVDEADVGRVEEGQQATFTVDAYPERSYSASVTRVAYGSTTTGEVVSYTAVLRVRNDDLSLRPGMTASAEVSTASVTSALLVPNAALRFTPASAAAAGGTGFVGSLLPGPRRAPAAAATVTGEAQRVWVLRDGVPVAVDVVAGDTDGRVTEIKAGDLTAGELVITDMSTEG